MKEYASDKIRNVAVLSHDGAGKTAVVESLLLAGGAVSAVGTGKDNKHIMDFEPEEIKRNVTIQLGIAPCEWDGYKLNFLDTPGYSKPDSAAYSARTDAAIARSQLNASDHILWCIPADAGAISTDDVNFLKSLSKDIPKLIIITKADKAPSDEDLRRMADGVRETLDRHGIRYADVLTSARGKHDACDREAIESCLKKLDEGKRTADFAYQFKKLYSPFLSFFLRHTCYFHRKAHIVKYISLCQQIKLLKYHSHRLSGLPYLIYTHPRKIASHIDHTSRSRYLKIINTSYQSRLSRTRQTYNSKYFSLVYVKVYIIQCMYSGILIYKAFT